MVILWCYSCTVASPWYPMPLLVLLLSLPPHHQRLAMLRLPHLHRLALPLVWTEKLRVLMREALGDERRLFVTMTLPARMKWVWWWMRWGFFFHSCINHCYIRRVIICESLHCIFPIKNLYEPCVKSSKISMYYSLLKNVWIIAICKILQKKNVIIG